MPMLLAGYQKGQVGKMNGFLFFRHSIFHSGDTYSSLSSSKTVRYVLWMQSTPIQLHILLFQRKEFKVFIFSCNSSKCRLLPGWQLAVGAAQRCSDIVPLCCSTAFSVSGHRCETSHLGSIKLWAPPRWGLNQPSVKAEIQDWLMPEGKHERFTDPISAKRVSLVQNNLKDFIPPLVQVKEKRSWRQQVLRVLKQFL